MVHSPALTFPDGILSPSPTVSYPIRNLESSVRLIPPAKSPASPNGICKPIPASSANSECKFSGVLECSIIFYLQVTTGEHANQACQYKKIEQGQLSYPKIFPPSSQDIPYIHTQRFLKS